MPEINHNPLANKEALAHFNNKVLLTTQHYAELKAYEHALAFTVAGISDKDMLTEVHKAMTQAMTNGTSFHDFKKQLKPYLMAKGWLGLTNSKDDQKYLGHRLRTIYHTNKATAYSAGQWERIQRTKEMLPFLQYMPSVSTNKRDEHKQFYGMVRPVDDPIWQSIFPPNGFGCFLGDVQIQGDLQSAMVKWYEGVAVEFTTKSGRNLTVTANHPILTARGWVRADGLTTSDDVLCYDLPINTVNADVLSGQIHHNQTEPTAKNLFKAFFNQTFAFTGTSAFKFNSDVANGEIHIDVINDGLVLHISADVLQGVQKFELIRGDDGRFTSYGDTVGSSDIAVIINDFISSQNAGDVATTAIKAFCQSTLAYFGCGVQMNNFSFQFVISGTTDRPSLSTLPFNATNRLFDTLPTDNTGTAHVSQDDTVLTELASNAFTTDFGLFGYLIDTHASIVFADPVINVRQFSFGGHVYDFQSSESIVSANGIIAHNCKCGVKQLTKTRAQKILDEQAEKGIVYDIEMEQVKHPLTGEMMTVPKGVHFSFNHNHDRLTALLKLAQDKHGAEFAQKLGVDLKGEMVGYAKKSNVAVNDFGGIKPRQAEVARLLIDKLDNKPKLHEAVAGEQYQQYHKVKLERPEPVFIDGKPQAGFDYWVTDTGQTLDFMYTMYGYNQFKIDKFNEFFAHTDEIWEGKKGQIIHHLEKADIVPLDLRYLTTENIVKLIAFVVSLSQEQQEKIILITGN